MEADIFPGAYARELGRLLKGTLLKVDDRTVCVDHIRDVTASVGTSGLLVSVGVVTTDGESFDLLEGLIYDGPRNVGAYNLSAREAAV